MLNRLNAAWATALQTMLAVSCLGFSAASGAQTAAPNPVVEHFKAYSAALKRQDFAAAETAAQAALDASVQAYGDGGRTAVLAFNLADVRLTQGKADAAAAPARKALEIAEAKGAASGLDPRLARLTLHRAELRSGGVAAIDRLKNSVAEVASDPALKTLAYGGAMDLALYASEKQRHGESRLAWATAADILRTQPNPNPMLLARAQLGEATAGVFALNKKSTRENFEASIARNVPEVDAYIEFDKLIVGAMDMIAPEARKPGPTREATPAQTLYAQGAALHAVIESKLRTDDMRLENLPQPQDVVGEIGHTRHVLRACSTRMVMDRKPTPSRGARIDGDVGAVVLKLNVNESGEIADSVVAGSIGGAALVRAVTDVVPKWRIEKDDPAEANCRVAREIFYTYYYYYW